MGQRANLVIKKGGSWTLYYSHWAANALDRYLFWGPEPARVFIEAQAEVAPSEWLDTIWCEGAALLDRDHKRLLFYGGEEVLREVPRRRLYLDLMRAAWQPWRVDWAHGGLVEIVTALGLDPATVAPETPATDTLVVWPSSDYDPDWADGVISVVRQELGLHRAVRTPENLLLGPGFSPCCLRPSPRSRWPTSRWAESTSCPTSESCMRGGPIPMRS